MGFLVLSGCQSDSTEPAPTTTCDDPARSEGDPCAAEGLACTFAVQCACGAPGTGTWTCTNGRWRGAACSWSVDNCDAGPAADGEPEDGPDVGGNDAGPYACAIGDAGLCVPITGGTDCTSWLGQRYDSDAECLEPAHVALGCCATHVGAACTAPTAPGCIVAADGSVWRSDSWIAIDGYEQCDPGGAAAVIPASVCGDGGP